MSPPRQPESAVDESYLTVGGRYRLGNLIGGGGMGAVWLARDEVLCRQVAIKQVVIRPNLNQRVIKSLCGNAIREAQAAARVSHSNAVRIYDVVQDRGVLGLLRREPAQRLRPTEVRAGLQRAAQIQERLALAS
jgi:hypothetical protein